MRAPASPQFRFLLRGSSLLLALLALWWWVLLTPMLGGMRVATDLILRTLPGGSSVGSVTLGSGKDWVLRVPMPAALANQDSVQRAFGRAPGAPAVKVRSFKLAIAEGIPTFFLLSFPLFWALVLAAPRMRRLGRVVAIGTGLLALLAELSLLLYTAFSIEINLHLVTSSAAAAIWRGAEYLNVNVVPYLVPLLLAVWLHEGLRAQIFSREAPLVPVAATEATEADKPRRGRYRGR
jgi:hypothetical protein